MACRRGQQFSITPLAQRSNSWPQLRPDISETGRKRGQAFTTSASPGHTGVRGPSHSWRSEVSAQEGIRFNALDGPVMGCCEEVGCARALGAQVSRICWTVVCCRLNPHWHKAMGCFHNFRVEDSQCSHVDLCSFHAYQWEHVESFASVLWRQMVACPHGQLTRTSRDGVKIRQKVSLCYVPVKQLTGVQEVVLGHLKLNGATTYNLTERGNNISIASTWFESFMK